MYIYAHKSKEVHYLYIIINCTYYFIKWNIEFHNRYNDIYYLITISITKQCMMLASKIKTLKIIEVTIERKGF